MTERHQDFGGLTTFVFGVIVGAGVALIFAPASGRETRRRLGAVDADAVTRRVNDAIDGVSGIVGRGVAAYKQASAETNA